MKKQVRIFFSHSSRDKPLIREIRRNLDSVNEIYFWIDERELVVGSGLQSSLKNAISQDTDLVIIFIAQEFITSPWLKRELNWALARERELKRTFILPVLIDKHIWEKIEPKNFRERVYIAGDDFTESGVKKLSDDIKKEIFRHLCNIGKDDCPSDAPGLSYEEHLYRLKAEIFDLDKHIAFLNSFLSRYRNMHEYITQENLPFEFRDPMEQLLYEEHLEELNNQILQTEKEIEKAINVKEKKEKELKTLL